MLSTPCRLCGQVHTSDVLCIHAALQAIEAILKNVGVVGQCRGCGAKVFWVEHVNGKRTPYTPKGLNHFVDCPASAKFKRG